MTKSGLGTSALKASRFARRGLMVGLLLVAASAGGRAPGTPEDLEDLLRRQTEEFSAAGRRGDKAAFERLLDDSVVFTNENGAMPTKREMIESLTPSSGASTLEVTKFRVVPQGDVATATFVDVLRQDFYGRTLQINYQSTETWAKRATGWKMIASHTMVVPGEPDEMRLTSSELDDYVGTYRANDRLVLAVSREGEELFSAVNGGPRRRLAAELRDLFFVPGLPGLRRTFLRDGQGKVNGYVLNVSGTDVLLQRVRSSTD